jgi:hypothetical protein
MKYSSGKEIDVLVHKLVKEGWIFTRGGRHGRLLPPFGQRALTIPCSPGDRRAYLNFRRDVKNSAQAAYEREQIEKAE